MAGSTNFQQWNPTQANQETDAAYASDAQRVGGAPNGVPFPSPTGNKLFYQMSTGITALMEMMAAKGYVVNDTSISTLAATLSALLTSSDIRGNLQVLSFSSTVACDISKFLGFQIPLNGNVNITASGQVAGDQVTFIFTQDSTGGRLVNFPGTWTGYTQPDPIPGAITIMSFKINSALAATAETPVMASTGSLRAGSIDRTPIGSISSSTGRFTTPATSDNSTNAATTAWVNLILAALGLQGLTVKMGTVSSGSSTASVSFSPAFPTSTIIVLLTPVDFGSNPIRDQVYLTAQSTAGFSAGTPGSTISFNWLAIGN